MSLEFEASGPDATRSEADDKIASSDKGRSKRRRSRNRQRGRGNGQVQSADTRRDGNNQNHPNSQERPASQKDAVSQKHPDRKNKSTSNRSPDTRNPDTSRGQNTGRPSGFSQDNGKNSGSNQRRQNTGLNAPLNRGIYSAIDLGTNNCRLLIARPTRGGFRVIDAFSRIVRLGEGVGANGRLSEVAMDRTIEALKVCSEKLARRNVTCMRHVATEACRVADNSVEFVARVKAETGINLDVITAGEEARLAVMGCQSLITSSNQNALVFDIGGGSTELIWVRVRRGRASEIRGWMSIPWGVVNLSEKYGMPGGTLSDGDYQQMVKTVYEHLQSFEDAHQISDVVRRKRTQLLGTSGTVTTLASLHLKLPRYIRDQVDGAWMKTGDVKTLSQEVARMTHAERSAQPCIGAERADLVVAGCAILDGILGMWDVPSLRVADRGIREGILRGLMETEEPPVRTDRKHVRSNRRHNKNG